MTRQPPSLDCDAGPDRDLAVLLEQLTARLQAGESVDEAELLAAHPEHADRLRALLPALRLLGDAASSERRGVSPTCLDDELPGDPIGDFQLLGEVGRGGMGVVYEAIQLSLNRRVALKVLPFAATMDPRQLLRFRHEAQAAALLHHPNIVPVHGVGCERGVHYYAMQLIEGRSLAAVIEGMRGDHAKPANETADFRPPSPPLRGRGAGGEGVSEGNPSPDPSPKRGGEQSTAPVAALSTQKTRRDKAHYRRLAELIAQAADALEYAHSMGVVHRDIKPGNLMLDDGGNLWVTDFGLAKLETAVELTMSGDLLGTLRYMSPEQALARHGLVDHRTDVYSLGATFYELLTLRPAVRGDSKADILRHLAFEEPVALRKLDRAIPSELETITLKCLAKNPAERYATAGELAADLRRFVEEQPIKAKPPRLRERAANWSRRHRYLVRSAVTIVVVSVLALAISTYLVWQKSVQVHTALESESRERRRAEANLQTACDAVLQMLVELGDERLAGIPRAEEVRRKVLQDALKFYQRLLQEQSNDPVAQHETALAYDSVGRIQNELGQNPEAIMAYREGIHLLEPLFAATPDDLDVRHNLAGCLCNLGNALCQSGRETEAVPVYRRAAEIQEGLVAQFPDNADYREYLVNIYIGLGVSESPVDPRKGRGHYERAVDQARQLVERFPKEVDYRKQLASAQGEVASALDDEGRPAEAEALHGQALRTLESLTAEFPDSADYRRRAAGFTYNFGQHLDRAGRFDESEKQY
ncbi:MAG TPA: serine/threonine-protein kinase, partial [Gemmataceae bacterium]|nr:serine/threonine-protein kinase [Gemmataceae bacterium]